eukprot:TRINITY_DN14366_c2_g1_i1.p1 TRINITY_DN14366_c2_g1~~TRINITY_DN14366_c2_g1_i1.p1  ORF type:complete len:118 (+),score=5.67 TRINITY_DN14366_c2_g1_i1:177-530(+)
MLDYPKHLPWEINHGTRILNVLSLGPVSGFMTLDLIKFGSDILVYKVYLPRTQKPGLDNPTAHGAATHTLFSSLLSRPLKENFLVHPWWYLQVPMQYKWTHIRSKLGQSSPHPMLSS